VGYVLFIASGYVDCYSLTFFVYILQIMYLAQAMIDNRSRFDHQCDRRDLLHLREEFHKQHVSLLKAWKENKALQAFKDKYEPEKEKLQESHRKLSENAWRNRNEKNELKREIQALKDELSARQQKIDGLESMHRKDFEEYDSRIQELSSDEEIDDSDTEGVPLEDTDTDTDESGDEGEGSEE